VSELPPTEARHPASAQLDLLASSELVELLLRDQQAAIDAVRSQRDEIARAVEAIAARLQHGGRLHYVGAGTSGRLAVLDASEMPPTFGTSPDLVCAHIAGGEAALRRAIENVEDDAQAGGAEMRGHVDARDAVVGLSASGGAQFVVAALDAARACGAYTVAITSVGGSALAHAADDAIVTPTGAEVLAGSTRLKAGTAQKIVLNALSTGVMVRLGKVYEDLMVDVVAANVKLRERALRIVCEITGVSLDEARRALEASGGRAKLAIVMLSRGVDAAQARALLAAHNDQLRPVIART
jgi:N-acetylmuramic acid 6-phosphate etherase